MTAIFRRSLPRWFDSSRPVKKPIAATDIKVSHFREILIWPFRLDLEGLPRVGGSDVRESVKKITKDLERSNWELVPDVLKYLRESGSCIEEEEYTEFVYFHSFVQKFLYPSSNEFGRDPHLWLFRRLDISAVTVELKDSIVGQFSVELAVERINLYLFCDGTAALVAEVAGREESNEKPLQIKVGDAFLPMTLAHAQVILDRFRRAYPPFWEKTGDSIAGLSPLAVRWHRQKCQTPAESCNPMPCKKDCLEQVLKHRQPPLAAYWQEILAPLRFKGYGKNGNNRDPRWCHVMDECIPVMAYLAVDGVDLICRDDWVRLAFLDGPGSDLDYGDEFLSDFEKEYCYDRFWSPQKSIRGTRYLISGYGFITVGDKSNWLFNNIILNHFRRHYFQIGLIAHIQTAALLALSDRLARAVAKITKPDGRALARDILRDVLEFTHRLWFPDISNHIQPREMYGLWRRHLRIDALYDEVSREAKDFNDYLKAEADQEAAEAAKRLNLIATVGLALSVAVGFLGMNIFVVGGEIVPEWDNWPLLISVLGAAFVVAGYGVKLAGRAPVAASLSSFGGRMALIGFVLVVASVLGYLSFLGYLS